MSFVPAVDVGTPKHLTNSLLIVSDDPGVAGISTVTITSGIPAGTKAIAGHISIGGTVAGSYFTVDPVGGTTTANDLVRVQVAGVVNDGSFFVRLNSSYQFDTYASAADITSRNIMITTVYL